MWLRVIIDALNPFRRVVEFINSEGVEFVCAIRYKCLLRFCYICELISHSTQRCDKKEESSKSNKMGFQYEKWSRAPT
ncbi:hypothetical protein Goari_016982 [Gossypium aridum]|uniref:Zinc knuckle CX2CX4HX4C domain-containing protein n=1 Tax=Gossypium aridum TaxID=34290 RepID=A0A7J8WK61_GOSAI|nr:hypothetical protein [Gossypium aridum]